MHIESLRALVSVRYELESKSVHCCLGGWKVFGRES